MKIVVKLLMGICLLYVPLQSMAWGNEGHQICGQITWRYLNPKARAAVNAILGGEHVAMASTWADDIKKEPQYQYTSPWHYIDIDKSYTYPELVNYLDQDKETDAYTRLLFFIGELKKKNLSPADKLFDLKMLIHLAEDLHQPLHTGHSGDRGGNNIRVTWQGEPTNLHAVWDNKIIENQQLSYTAYASRINHCTAQQRMQWQSEPISRWVFESHQIAEKLYKDIKPGDNLGGDYSYKYAGILNQQLLKAGVRLAGVLNQIFG